MVDRSVVFGSKVSNGGNVREDSSPAPGEEDGKDKSGKKRWFNLNLKGSTDKRST